MTTTTTKEPRVTRPVLGRTPDQIKAQARMLDGAASRTPAAAAAVSPAGAATPPAPESNDTIGELWLYGVVGGWWRGFDAESVANALRDMDVDVLHVRIHSPGGAASDGAAIANLLRNHAARVVVVVDGLAASAASVIALAGDQVIMCPGSQMMLHDVSTGMFGNAKELRTIADWVDGQSNNYAGVYAYRAGGTAAEWRAVMTANDGMGTWYGAEAAVTAKLADTVGTLTAIGSPPVAPDAGFVDGGDEEMLARVEHDLLILEQHVHPAARAVWRGERPKPPTASADGTPKKEGPTLVDFTPENIAALRQHVGFAEDADADTIVSATLEALSEQADPPAAPAAPGDGMVVVPQAAWDEAQHNARLGAQAAEQLRVQDREAFLDAHADRFLPVNRAAYQAQYDANPQGTREYLESAAVIVPLAEIGHGVPKADAQQDDSWFPGYSTPSTAKEA